MKAFLLYPDADFDLSAPLPDNERDLADDLDLTRLYEAMAMGDNFLYDIARRVMMTPLQNEPEVLFRQQVLADCLSNAAVVRELYDLAVETITGEKKIHIGLFDRYPETILQRAIEVMQFLVGMMRRLRAIAETHAAEFTSTGFARLFAMLTAELSDGYFALIEEHLKRLRFKAGVLMSARLGRGGKALDFVLREPPTRRRGLLGRLGAKEDAYVLRVHERDEAGLKALAELRDRGLNPVANALAQANDHVLSFFRMLQTELGFYVGCLNLHDQLGSLGVRACVPTPVAPAAPVLSARGLFDICLALRLGGPVVPNDVDADGAHLIMIGGANTGGKSTFLRSVGLAQVMMQAGLFVAADDFRANLCTRVFTHYKREEDSAMRSGKLEEELVRMSGIVSAIRPNCLLLCNESFAATNEREGSEIARQITIALVESGVKLLYVTHLYDLAEGLYRRRSADALFLQAERRPDGERTFRIRPGEPTSTSYGGDLYRQVFGTEVPERRQ